MREWLTDPEAVNTKQTIIDENEALKEEIHRLEEENRRLAAEARRASNLEKLYDLDTFYKDYPKIAAQIIGLSPNNWLESYMIDKGSEDGLALYMPVIADGGLIGHITKITPHYALITSIVNQSSIIYGQVNRGNGDMVAVQGASGYRSLDINTTDEETCVIRFVTNEIDITVGDEIVTSSLGDIYPPGLLIGTVIDIQPLGSGYESIAYVKPTASLDQVDLVLVITEEWKKDMQEEINPVYGEDDEK